MRRQEPHGVQRGSASRLAIATTLVALLASALSVPASHAAEPRGGAMRPGGIEAATGSRGSIDVAALPAVPAVPTARTEAPRLRSPYQGDATAAPSDVTSEVADTFGFPTRVVPTTAPPAHQPGWTGMRYADTGHQPADPWVAAGPDHIVQVVNTSVKMWGRTGTTKKGVTEIAAAGLFDLPAGFENSDPRVFFDAAHGRWVMSELSWTCDAWTDGVNDYGASGFVDFLVSRTADPTGTWDSWYIFYEGYLPDYPAFGASTDKLGAGENFFALTDGPDCTSGATYAGAGVQVVDWADLLDGDGAFTIQEFFFDDGVSGWFTPRVALQAPATSPVLYVIVQRFDPATSALTPYFARVTGAVSNGTIGVPYQVDLAGIGVIGPMIEPPAPIQPGGSMVTGAIDSRPTDLIWQANRLTWVSSHACQFGTDDTARSCVRVSQVGTGSDVAADPVRTQDFVIGDEGEYHFFGGIGQAMDGTLHVVWTRSFDGSGGYPTSVSGYQRRGEAGKLSAPEVLGQGLGPAFTGDRWGDYVGVAQDPQVPNAVWQGNMYSSGGLNWSTAVSQLQTGGATFVPIAPLRVLDSRSAVGVSGIFVANTPRDFVVAGTGMIPDDAIAVTGNLAVTGQTGAGYVSLTPMKTNTPRSSSLNFPTGDVRANNVTVPLSPTGRLAAVYKAAAGRRAHLILDVTGYFVSGTTQAGYNTMTPARFLDSRTGKGIGLTGRFQNGVPRKLDVAGVKGVPAGAVAVTANLTVVNQSKGGYVSVTPTSQANPATSTINFPTGDVRANGLTARLQGGDLWLVFKAGAGAATTDLILDVTGYYLAAGAGLTFYPLEPGRIMDTRTTLLTGLTGRFTSGTPRQLDTDGHWGVPAGAKAVTGNLTITAQTGGGHVSITPTSQANPTTSTLNFPTGDTRANGVTVPLHTDGSQYLVYKSASGARTHLILDVTGYFR